MSPPAQRNCYIPECDYLTAVGLPNHDLLIKDLELHVRCAHPQLLPVTQNQNPRQGHEHGPKPDRLPRPNVGEGITESDWRHFSDKWSRYKRSTLTGASAEHVSDQLWACCDEGLEKAVNNTGLNSSSTEEQLLGAMKSLAVRAQNNLVNVVKFFDMDQEQEEPVGAFSARLKGQAAICNFTIQCSSPTCSNICNFSDLMVTHQLVCGLADSSIQEQVLGHGAGKKDLDFAETLQLIESKEAGKRSSHLLTSTAGLNKMSEFQKQKFVDKIKPGKGIMNLNKKCGWCGLTGHGARSGVEIRREKCQAFNNVCDTCSATGHFTAVCRSKKKSRSELGAFTEEYSLGEGNFCKLSSISTQSAASRKILPHTAFDEFKGWVAAKPEKHSQLPVLASLYTQGYEQLGIPSPKCINRRVEYISLPDTSAQISDAGIKFSHGLGVKKTELIPLLHGVNVANNDGLRLLGGLLATFIGTDSNGRSRQTRQLCYIAEGIDGLYLSRTACMDLGLIGNNFPQIGAYL